DRQSQNRCRRAVLVGVDEMTEDCVIGSMKPVHAPREGVDVQWIAKIADEIRVSRRIRRGNQIDQRTGNRIDPVRRDDIARKGVSHRRSIRGAGYREWIEDLALEYRPAQCVYAGLRTQLGREVPRLLSVRKHLARDDLILT